MGNCDKAIEQRVNKATELLSQIWGIAIKQLNKGANKAPEVVVQTFTIHFNETRGYSDNPMKKILEKTPIF